MKPFKTASGVYMVCLRDEASDSHFGDSDA